MSRVLHITWKDMTTQTDKPFPTMFFACADDKNVRVKKNVAMKKA